ncbi:MAG: radical SAM family heme chaperone HemW, partial [Deltaproteobacteria bacterium]|nr:radical SAM family heme chaperone HemW [Deltaproteobacteria bacterium]
FCLKKCSYCSFNSYESTRNDYGSYIEALLMELAFRCEEMHSLHGRGVESIYIGGGTPSLLAPDEIVRLLDGARQMMRHRDDSGDDSEVTIEVNPGTVDYEKLSRYRDAGVNRVSIGIQSFNDSSLKALGRLHSAGDGVASFQSARRAEFRNIGADLIFALPGQTVAEWERDVEELLNLMPEHISLYALKMEEGTPFYVKYGAGGPPTPSEEEAVAMYRSALERLEGAGYRHYEVSNLALPGFTSRHNSRYWRGGDYIGLGAGAHSYLASPGWGERWWNLSGPDAYVEDIMARRGGVEGKEELTRENALHETLFLGLRTMEGVEIAPFRERFGLSPVECLPMDRLTGRGLISSGKGWLRLTREGILLSDEVFSYLHEEALP